MKSQIQQQHKRLNCWEFMECGREPDGDKEHELGVCPASTRDAQDGLNHGKRGGRVCWALVGTLCFGEVQGVFVEKIATCLECEFYHYVRRQENKDFRHALPQKNNDL